ncbi:hypothetical protein CEUSTIGMA_g13581.t1 [Chlamydomonas eustigma]|uniref:EF-hand domain-containing protein n=1 Tax=Chlamydomonas eustigma TaxID=1157962 RepID=A0A250XSY5_9CHLO|nr:hypothetical protein CEUSTIGMA_g13581.t1 [Chlamydomonas eustigma]|eukprot:GAX86168.1 hypothetical protein CEUSTIGMA_g13581.t1 [Chlamydomonas eustigma]
MTEVAVDRVGFEALGGEAEGVEALQKKLDLLKREEALIKEELARAAVAHWQQGAASSSHGKPSSKSTAGNVASSAVGSETSEEEVAAAAAEEQQRRLRKAVQALLDLATGSGVAKERVTFMELLKNETDRLNEDLFKKPTGTLVFSNKGMEVSKTPEGEEEEPLRGAGGTSVSRGAETEEDESMPKRLSDRVSRMLIDIEKELDKVELSIGSRMHVLDTNRDGIISQEELEQAFLLIKAQLTPEEHLQLYKQLRALSADNSGDIHMTNLLQLAASAKESAQSDAGVESVHIHIK